MSCNCGTPSCHGNPCCRPGAPICDATNEPLQSALDNFIYWFFGVITKACNAEGEVQWTLPCDLSSAEPIPGFPRLPNEGIACYLIRYILGLSAGGPCSGSPRIELALTVEGEIEIDWSLGCYFSFDGEGTESETTVTFRHINLPTDPLSKTISLLLTGSTGYQINWENTKWADGLGLIQPSGGDDVATFTSFAGGTPHGSAIVNMS